MPKWKYADHLASLPHCPPLEAQPRNCNAFRYVWNPIGPDSFIPVAFKRMSPPRRMNHSTPNNCSAYGLSMFSTEKDARTRFNQLEEKHRGFRKTVGEHLASVALTVMHGAQTPENAAGHFDLHEYHGVELASVSVIVGAL